MARRTQARSPETDAGALLGDELRQLRIAAGFKIQDDIADAVGVDRSAIGRIETGERPPAPELLAVLLDAYKVTGRLRTVYERLAIVNRARSGDGPVRIWFAGYLKAEGEATSIRLWAPTIMPGLVQVPGYVRALFRSAGIGEAGVEGAVAERMRRQEILNRAEPPGVVIVLWEPVLHHLIGSPDVMREQMDRLLALSETSVVQVVPESLAGNAGLGGSIALAARPGTAEVLLTTSMLEDMVTQDVGQVTQAGQIFDRVRGDAESRAASRNIIREILETWDSRK